MENTPSVPTAGSLAWFSDAPLLAKYGVTVSDIYRTINEVITETNRQNQEMIAKKGSGTFQITMGDKYFEIDIDRLSEEKTEKIPCGYCKQEQIADTIYSIRNRETGEYLDFPSVMLHLSEHDDLGDPGQYHKSVTLFHGDGGQYPVPYRINPSKACRVLELCDTNIA